MSRHGSPSFGAFLVDGYDLLAMKVQQVRWKVTNALRRSDGLGDIWDEHSYTGKRNAELAQTGGYFDTSANNSHTALKGLPAQLSTTRIVAWAPAGNVLGGLFVGAQGVLQLDYDVVIESDDVTKANAAYRVSGAVDEGMIIQEHEVKTGDWNTKDTEGQTIDYTLDPLQVAIPIASSSVANPTVITTTVPHGLSAGHIVLISGHAGATPSINGQHAVTVLNTTQFTIPVNVSVAGTGGQFVKANTLAGGVGYHLVSALSGFTSYVARMRDSADNVTFADLVVFTNVTTAPSAERVTVAGTIDRYLSFVGEVDGTGSVKPFAGLKRN